MDSSFKAGLKETVLALMAEKKEDLNAQLLALQEASNADTKSSMGDKYETGRESINQSRDLLEKQKQLLDRDEKMVTQTAVDPSATVCPGALIKVQLGWLWLAASVGKVIHQGQEIQVVSSDSPLVVALKGKRAGDEVAFRGRSMKILQVV